MARPKQLINREISWLAFNKRVLDEAADASVPLMERIKFLGIFSNNRDEFFRVRVASVKRLAALNERIEASDDDAKQIFALIQKITIDQQKKYESIYRELIEELKTENVFLVNEHELNEYQQAFVTKYYHDKVDPIIGPIMLDQVKKFPELRDKAIYLAAILSIHEPKKKPSLQYALMEVPASLPRFVNLPDENGNKYIIILDDIIRYNLMDAFVVLKPTEVKAFTFKITRDAELDLDNDISKSFLEKMKKSLRARKRGAPVRFVFDSTMPLELQKYLAKKMNLISVEDAFIPGGRYHNLKDLISFPKLAIPKAYYKVLTSQPHPQFKKFDSAFTAIRKKDVMLHYPYQTFNHVIDLLREAALDPHVKSIKICLYRVSKQSKVVNALINAARNGKKVIVIFELQARFDEENNIYWSNILEDEGAKVYFGFPGLKVHGKICLISRKEFGNMAQYAIVATGNFNENTASLYGDFSLLTADERVTSEVNRVFDLFENAIWPNYRFKHLVLSPFYLRNRLVRLINKEIKNAKFGKESYIHLKFNSLVDTHLIHKLYEASQAGVKIKMIIRGVCALIPGVKGMSENIEVISIVDRYLEHARFYCFCNEGDPLYFISSADWMVRNIDRRIEVTCPIYDNDLKKEIDHLFKLQFSDNLKARKLMPNGEYVSVKPMNKKDIRSQYELFEYHKKKSKAE
jgi:polyphosphate kinase